MAPNLILSSKRAAFARWFTLPRKALSLSSHNITCFLLLNFFTPNKRDQAECRRCSRTFPGPRWKQGRPRKAPGWRAAAPTSWECFSPAGLTDRKSTRLNSSHLVISYAVFCLKKKKQFSRATDQDPKVFQCPRDLLD